MIRYKIHVMNRSINFKINIFIVIFFITVFFAVTGVSVSAVSVPKAYGLVSSGDGAVMRKSSNTASKKVTTLGYGTTITIHKEVFKKKTSTAKTSKWYYVTANGKKGFVRSDLVGDISYGSVKGKIRSATNYRKGPGTKMKIKGRYRKNARITVVLTANPVYSTRGSSKKWYKVTDGSKYFYVCSRNVKLTGSATSAADPGYASYVKTPVANMTDAQFNSYLKDQGFPASYKKKLIALHKLHPNWGFAGYKTGIAWKDALAKECKGGVSLVSGAYKASYRDGKKQYEPGWYKANKKVVAYYMDPRNFLNENSIYMFEDLSYKPEYQTSGVVGVILAQTKLPANGFTADIFVKAGAENNVSPVFLASRARQETGSGSDAITGKTTLGKVYNPFNIGAFGGTNPLYNGLVFAKVKGWDTPAKAVSGGAAELAKNYIHQGQFTTYYQRFNVRNGAKKIGTHQYMTNIMAPCSEASSTKNSYIKYGITGQPLVFEIPIYKSMPKETKLP